MLSHVQLFVIPWTVAHQAPLSMGFSRQKYWSELSFPPPEDLLDPGIKPGFLRLLHWQADSLPLSHLRNPLNVRHGHIFLHIFLTGPRGGGVPLPFKFFK